MEPEKQGERKEGSQKETNETEVGGRLGARPKEVCVQRSDTRETALRA